jgi:hypothetical protein
MELEFLPEDHEIITIKHNLKGLIEICQNKDVIYLRPLDLPRFIHELQVIKAAIL